MSKGVWERYFDAMKKQDWDSARRSLLTLAQTEKNNPQVHLKIGDIDQRLGLTAEAIDAYHHAAYLLRSDGFLQKAGALYKIILRLDPENAQALSLSKQLLEELDAAKGGKSRFGVPAESPSAESVTAGQVSAAMLQTAEIPQPAASDAAIPDFFTGIPETAAKNFLLSLPVRAYDDGRTVIQEGDSGDSMYIIRAGNARVIAHLLGRELELGVLGVNDLFGEVSFLSGRPRTASVVASGPLEVYELGRPELEELIALNPSILANLEEFRQSRARETISRVKRTIP
ncbi:MAG: hypothetical protein OHK006_11240 [Thermodesulfovibrionales bacterium]